MYKITYNGWLCGNDSYPQRIKTKYKDKINREVLGFNHLAKQIANNEKDWQYVDQEYRIKGDFRGHSLRHKPFDHFLKINDRKVLVEFDGAQHYTKISQIIKDKFYRQAAQKYGFELIRIPYYLQLNTALVNLFFNTELANTQISHTFLQGFRVNGELTIPEFNGTKAEGFTNSLKYKSILPTEFNAFGLERFNEEICYLNQNGFHRIVEEIKESLKCRAKDYGWDEKYAIPDIDWE